MPDRKKVREYRDTLHKMARGGAQDETKAKELEGKAAKLGVEIYGEERKGKPQTKTKGRPRR
jgi:hypothetical protein